MLSGLFVIPSEDAKILELIQYRKSDKAPFIIYADLESSIEKIDGCKNNREKSSRIKVSKHIPSGFPIPTLSKKLSKKLQQFFAKDQAMIIILF